MGNEGWYLPAIDLGMAKKSFRIVKLSEASLRTCEDMLSLFRASLQDLSIAAKQARDQDPKNGALRRSLGDVSEEMEYRKENIRMLAMAIDRFYKEVDQAQQKLINGIRAITFEYGEEIKKWKNR